MFVAQSMAEYLGTVVDESHLKASIAAKQEVHSDYLGAGAVESQNFYL